MDNPTPEVNGLATPLLLCSILSSKWTGTHYYIDHLLCSAHLSNATLFQKDPHRHTQECFPSYLSTPGMLTRKTGSLWNYFRSFNQTSDKTGLCLEKHQFSAEN